MPSKKEKSKVSKSEDLLEYEYAKTYDMDDDTSVSLTGAARCRIVAAKHAVKKFDERQDKLKLLHEKMNKLGVIKTKEDAIKSSRYLSIAERLREKQEDACGGEPYAYIPDTVIKQVKKEKKAKKAKSKKRK